MMAMIEAVLWRAAVRILDIVMIGEEFVEAPKSPKHRRHTARDYINALNTITGQPIRWTLGVETRQIGSRHAGQILRIGQLPGDEAARSEEHTSELQSLMRISYAVFCL